MLLLLEKHKLRLQKVEDEFYDKIRKRISELEELKQKANEGEYQRYEDEIRTIKRIQKKIFEMRTGKIINAAWAEVCGQPVSEDMENMISEERKLFKNLVEMMREFKRRVLEGMMEKRKEEYILVRIKRDIEIQGIDGKTYKLRREDAVTLPSLNAETLVKSGLAEKIEVKDHEVS